VKIAAVRTFPIHLTVRPEFYIVSSAGAHAVSRYVVVAIDTDAGVTGWGEATVVPLWSGESQGGALALLHDYIAPLLIGRDPMEVAALAGEMDAIALDNPFTKAAVEMALLDLVGKAQEKPVYELLGGAANPLKIPIKFSIGLREPDDAANIAAGKVRDGFTAKMCIHPDQVEVINRIFTPSPEAIAKARRIVEAFAKAGDAGVIGLDGEMLDVPHLKAAKALLSRIS